MFLSSCASSWALSWDLVKFLGNRLTSPGVPFAGCWACLEQCSVSARSSPRLRRALPGSSTQCPWIIRFSSLIAGIGRCFWPWPSLFRCFLLPDWVASSHRALLVLCWVCGALWRHPGFFLSQLSSLPLCLPPWSLCFASAFSFRGIWLVETPGHPSLGHSLETLEGAQHLGVSPHWFPVSRELLFFVAWWLGPSESLFHALCHSASCFWAEGKSWVESKAPSHSL